MFLRVYAAALRWQAAALWFATSPHAVASPGNVFAARAPHGSRPSAQVVRAISDTHPEGVHKGAPTIGGADPEVAVKRLTICIVLAALLTLVVGAVPARAATLTKPERQLLALVNHVRAKHGLCKLTVSPYLQKAAGAHSHEMLRRSYFSHDSYNGDSFARRLMRFGFTTKGCRSWAAGECIAWGADSLGSPKAVFRAWMHSAPHRAVIFCARFRRVGVGRAKGSYKGLSNVVFFTLDCGARTT